MKKIIKFNNMAKLRYEALQASYTRQAVKVDFPADKNSDFFGINVFDLSKMQKYLSKDAFKAVETAVRKGTRIERKMADQVAVGMKAWAMERGVTHYTHWFQPLTDSTAEKHDAFLSIDGHGTPFESFDGKLLVQQEPDASSFPSGGIRTTFEARGYSAWDPTSPAFIIGKTLCIPSIFISYTGESLDYKTPLLKALAVLDKAAVDVCQFFDKDVTKVIATLGWEQEYFLVDEALYYARPDLALTNRTLMGHAAAKDQQLEDHYFGSIPERALAFMQELEVEAYKLGIPCKTRHNEVAPNQFECAPVFEECNLGVDHNILLMDLMRRVARRHRFKVLLHEKPFKGINGSGKHNNWSMATDTGVNLLQPGNTPKSNLQFLTFVVNAVKAVYDYAPLLQASIASAGNEHRLGANEAPPAIISVFLGTQVSNMLDEIEERVNNRKMTPDEKTDLKLNVGKIPEILLDNTDRNRTSPFAFTGNRFEFRAVGSSSNCGAAMLALNTAVANQLKMFKEDVEELVAKDVKRDEAIFQILRKYIIASKPVRFEGDNYSQAWRDEAARRGLPNVTSAPEALKAYVSEKTVKLLEGNGVLTHREIEARYEIQLEKYIKKIQIEARVFGDLAMNHIVPIAIEYQTRLIQNVEGLMDIFSKEEAIELAADRLATIKEISKHIAEIKTKVEALVEERKIANAVENTEDKATAYAKKVKPIMEEVRYNIDKLELMIDNEMWPLPKYRELLFTR